MQSDFEIINDCIEQIRWSDADGEYDKVIEAAERMAEENRRLTNEVKDLSIFYYEAQAQKKTIDNLHTEVARLKADLAAAKPITCGECEHRNFCRKEMNLDKREVWSQKVDYCSRAERKEAK